MAAFPQQLNPGQSCTMLWISARTTQCNASDAWTGTKALYGHEGMSPPSTATYTMTCMGSGGTISRSITITVAGSPAPPNPPAPPVPTNGLIAYWPFDEQSGTIAHDASGHGHDGRVEGATWTTGRRAGGLAFDGVNDLVRVAAHAALDTPDAFSVALWLNPNDVPKVDERVLCKVNVWDIKLDDLTPQFTAKGSVQADATLVSGQWAHLVLTNKKGKFKWYVNGKETSLEKNTIDRDSSLKSKLTELWIGTDGKSFFRGTLDDVLLYNRALSEKEVQQLYRAGSAPPPAPPASPPSPNPPSPPSP